MFKIGQRFDRLVDSLVDTHQVVPALRRENKVAECSRGAGTLVWLPGTQLDPSDWRLRDLGDRSMREPFGSGTGGKRMDGARRK
jgi:hypothetical protein